MGVPVHPSRAGGDELNLYPQYQTRESDVRAWWARAISVVLHLSVVCLFAFTPLGGVRVHDINRIVGEFKNPVRLIAPPSLLTQKAPNRGKVGKEFNLRSLMPRPPAFIPPSVAPGGPPSSAFAPLPEPPKLDSGQSPRPFGTDLSVLPPRLRKSNPRRSPSWLSRSLVRLRLSRRARERLRRLLHRSPRWDATWPAEGGSGGQAVTDYSGLLGGAVDAPNEPLPPGSVGSGLELLSDSRGVDFRSYLTQILAAVKRNWQAVIPESARRGERRGRVTVRFSVSRDGKVTNVQITVPSGTEALDLARSPGSAPPIHFRPCPPNTTASPSGSNSSSSTTCGRSKRFGSASRRVY